MDSPAPAAPPPPPLPSPPPPLRPPPSRAALDLNLSLHSHHLITPKIEPGIEPLANETLEIEARGPNLSLKSCPDEVGGVEAENPVPLQHLSPENEEEALFSEYYRLAQLFLSSFASRKLSQRHGGGDTVAGAAGVGKSGHRHPTSRANVSNGDAGAIIPAPPQDAGASNAMILARKKRVRSTEMVRVSIQGARDRRHFRNLVRSTRATYESLRSLLIRLEERGESPGLLGKRGRADLKAAALMKDRDLWLNRDKRIIGDIPGIHVGDIFFYRMELCVVGLHGQVQAGIDHVPPNGSTNGEPIATSIISSGGYEDDEDGGDVIIYTGHGGRDQLRRQSIDQKLGGGNLALERSMNYGIEIRVVRGFRSDRSPNGRVYVYDGLYKIVDYWLDVGKSGFGVYKYKLVRIQGQSAMGSTTFRFAEDLKVNLLNKRPAGYLSFDMSMGKEKLPILLFNDIDGDTDPLFYEYLVSPVYPPLAFQQMFNGRGGGGCDCVSNCSQDCFCAMKNGGEFAYDGNGVLLRGKPLIYECGSSCRCPQTCVNRVSQKGVKNRLEVFRSRETGWGVRSLDLIRAGTFVCEFSGIVLTKQQSEVLSINGDGLIYPNRFPPRWAEWGDISRVFPDYVRPVTPPLPPLSFSIDVSRMRNVACYLSHSCSPNVFVQFVLYDHNNLLYPHLMIFAAENIPPLRELSIDYGVGDTWVEDPPLPPPMILAKGEPQEVISS